MTKVAPKLPHEDSPIAKLLQTRIAYLSDKKSQREIAAEIGYEKPNVLSMYKCGQAKVPLDRLPAFAKALEVDFGFLLRLALQDYYPALSSVINDTMRVVSQNDRDWLDLLPDVFEEADPAPTPERIAMMRELFAKTATAAA